jgi:hypothetical protein
MKVSWDDDSQYDGKVIKFHGSKPPTRLRSERLRTIQGVGFQEHSTHPTPWDLQLTDANGLTLKRAGAQPQQLVQQRLHLGLLQG